MSPAGATLPRYGPVSSWLQRWFGSRVRSAPSQATAGVATATLLQSNPNRMGFTVINLSTNNVFVAPAEAGTVSSTNGILLAPSGGALSVQVQNDGDLSEHAWNIIASGAGSAVFVNELLAY